MISSTLHFEIDRCRFVMFLFARLSRHVMAIQDTGAYIAVILGTVVVVVKRKFDIFMVFPVALFQFWVTLLVISRRARLNTLKK